MLTRRGRCFRWAARCRATRLAAARSSRDPRDRRAVELMARTGMRVGELFNLEADTRVREIGVVLLAEALELPVLVLQ